MRRQLLLGAVACGTAAQALSACTSAADEDAAARLLRQPLAVPGGGPASAQAGGLNSAAAPVPNELMRELVRCATFAPSSHNTQCWTFRLQARAIWVEPDLSRRCPVVDPDDHHLYVSLGCATENLAQAALANGLQASARFDPSGAGRIAVDLQPTQARQSALYQAIPARQCTRGDYDGKPLSAAELSLLERAGSGNGVRVMLLTEPRALEQVLENVVAGSTAQLRRALPCSCRRRTTRRNGWKPAAATNASRCRPPRSACATRS